MPATPKLLPVAAGVVSQPDKLPFWKSPLTMRLAKVGWAVAINRTPIGRKNVAKYLFIEALIRGREQLSKLDRRLTFRDRPPLSFPSRRFMLESTAETQPQRQPALLRLSAMVS